MVTDMNILVVTYVENFGKVEADPVQDPLLKYNRVLKGSYITPKRKDKDVLASCKNS